MEQPTVREIKMTSMELAEITGKQHAHVMRDIRSEMESLGDDIGQSIFGLTSRKDQWNREQPCYEFGKDGAMQLALKYDAITRRKVILKLEEFEKLRIPTGQNLLALAVIEAQRIIEQKDQQIIEMKPKADFFDAVADSKTAIAMDQVAKVLGCIGRNRLFDILREKQVLMSNNLPYQRYIDNGWFRVVEQKYQKPNGDICINTKTLVYQKGVEQIRKIVA
jgi:phage antirepressor YoqD-like protein